ncbi:DUF1679 domain-containing protein [Fulvivirga sp. RKSG066]|nr:DUF1679 domain-containing protein [Fulvivirga aurantia]
MDIEHIVLNITQADEITKTALVQELWSGYGEIKRYNLKGGTHPSVIVKHIHYPNQHKHPRGWNTNISHQRKLKSYQVERTWYQQYADKTNDHCRVPQSFHAVEVGDELLLIMEDLDTSGYPKRLNPDLVTLKDAKNCLSWLASFHAQFMNTKPDGLWTIGTYWHYDTRPDEWGKMQNLPLKKAAKGIDERLYNAQYQTLVHGDAKLANFCFSENGKVAAVDFQYVGGGCGIKDVAYFISSCFEESECEKYEKELLDHYFDQLELMLDKSIDFQLVKNEWLALYPYAWADFYRFLDGWSPGHWKMHDYSKRLTQKVIEELNQS